MQKQNWPPELDFELIGSLIKVEKKRQNLKRKYKKLPRKASIPAFGEAIIPIFKICLFP
jgi:hypothetical protein